MKTIQSILIAVITITILSCSKSSDKPKTTSSLDGVWVTTVWGGENNTAKMQVTTSKGEGVLTYLSESAKEATNFSTSDIILTNIKSTGSATYSATLTYRYTASSGGFNANIGSTSATLTLQSGNTVLYMNPSKDASTGVTPPVYYWTKE